MEAFSLLKYWRGNGGGGATVDLVSNTRASTGTTTIVTEVNHNVTESDDDGDDDGPFFDLEFSVPDEDEQDGGDEALNGGANGVRDCVNGSEDDDEDEDSDGVEDEREFDFTISSGSSNDRADTNLSLSPSDDLFFKGRVVPIEPSSIDFTGPESEPNSKPQFRVPLLKSATKFRVFMLGLKKSKSNSEEKTEQNGSVSVSSAPKQQPKQATPLNQPEKQPPPQPQPQPHQSKLFTVKLKVEEVPIVSLFTRDNSSRSSSANKFQRLSSDEPISDEQKKFSKDVMQKYLKMVKPLYIKVSRRYGEKVKFSGKLSSGGGAKAEAPLPSAPAEKSAPPTSPAEKSPTEPEVAEPPAPANNAKIQKQGNLPAGFRVVRKHLGKSRSASSAVAAAPQGPAPSRRDDSLLQQQDGIQSAILHCKRSFNAPRDSDSVVLSRSVSDPLHEKASDLSRKSPDEEKGEEDV